MLLRNLRGLARAIAIRVIKVVCSRDLRIRHHWTGKPIRLHGFNHKGYWYHGRRREFRTFVAFERLLCAGDCVFDVGGHIGYFSMYFADRVGPGQVVCFEPGENNLKYTRENVAQYSNVTLIERAVGSGVGVLPFYEEDLSGQNNSLHRDYRNVDENARSAHMKVHRRVRTVPVTTIDSIAAELSACPTFIKVDAEGAELDILRGAVSTIRKHCPMWMIEVTQNKDDVWTLLTGSGYMLLKPDGRPIMGPEETEYNVFCLHKLRHQDRIAKFCQSNTA